MLIWLKYIFVLEWKVIFVPEKYKVMTEWEETIKATCGWNETARR